MTKNTPPAVDELEVSLFGPGVGECVVVHVGAGEWMIVDSCIDRATGNPVALDYLEGLGVDVATAVRTVVVTHWHDDHMRGAARVFQAAKSAKFCCSSVLQDSEFMQLVGAESLISLRSSAGSGVSEFARIQELLLERRGSARAESVGPEYASADKRIFFRPWLFALPSREVWALSPSSATCTRGLREIAELLPKVGQPKRAVVSTAPNETSVVLSVHFGRAVALLGADLEATSNPTTGWSAVVASESRPPIKAHTYKHPHHGSKNAHHDDVWALMVEPEVIALLTPYAAGRKTLPSKSDVKRIKELAGSVYCTARIPTKARITDSMVARTVKEVAPIFRQRTGAMGQVRVRLSAQTAARSVELFGAAYAA